MGNQSSAKTIILSAPQGWGKTTHADALQAHFGCIGVVDCWHAGLAIKAGHLHLTNSQTCAQKSVSNPMVNEVLIIHSTPTAADFLGLK